MQAGANCKQQRRTCSITIPACRHKFHLECVAVQLADVVRKLLNIFGDALISVGEAAKSRGSIVSTVTAVLLVQVVGQSTLECNLNPFLHVLETTVHCCRGNGNTSKGSQEPGKLRKVLQAAPQ